MCSIHRAVESIIELACESRGVIETQFTVVGNKARKKFPKKARRREILVLRSKLRKN
jgi:hypothetical protein